VWQEKVAKYLTFSFMAFEAVFILFTLGLFFIRCKNESPVDRMQRWEERVGSIYKALAYKEAF
jgi:hypothetical protein